MEAKERPMLDRQLYIGCMESRGYRVADDLSADKFIMGPGERQRDHAECAVLAAR
jgi:hypothetical protein